MSMNLRTAPSPWNGKPLRRTTQWIRLSGHNAHKERYELYVLCMCGCVHVCIACMFILIHSHVAGHVYILLATTMYQYMQRYIQVLVITVSVCFQIHSSQIFEEVEDVVSSIMDGFNVTIFAYGQTGSGKTHYGGVCCFYIPCVVCVCV